MTDTVAAKPSKKIAFPNATRGGTYGFDPMDVRLVGGLLLPEDERGPLDTEVDKAHPLYDERLKKPLTEEFINNIDAFGVIAPGEIVKGEDGHPEVVDARRRVRAARIVNKRRAKRGEPLITVEFKLVRADEVAQLERMITHNENREDDTPSVKIAKVKRMLARGVSEERAATVFGKNVQTIKAWLAYDDNAIAAVKKAVDAFKIPQSTGADIARLDKDKQEKALEAILATAVTDKGKRPKRGGQAAKAKRIIKNAARPDESPGIDDKKTMKKFLEAVENMEHKGATDATLMWWDGVEAALHLILGDDGSDKKLVKILADLE